MLDLNKIVEPSLDNHVSRKIVSKKRKIESWEKDFQLFLTVKGTDNAFIAFYISLSLSNPYEKTTVTDFSKDDLFIKENSPIVEKIKNAFKGKKTDEKKLEQTYEINGENYIKFKVEAVDKETFELDNFKSFKNEHIIEDILNSIEENDRIYFNYIEVDKAIYNNYNFTDILNLNGLIYEHSIVNNLTYIRSDSRSIANSITMKSNLLRNSYMDYAKKIKRDSFKFLGADEIDDVADCLWGINSGIRYYIARFKSNNRIDENKPILLSAYIKIKTLNKLAENLNLTFNSIDNCLNSINEKYGLDNTEWQDELIKIAITDGLNNAIQDKEYYRELVERSNRGTYAFTEDNKENIPPRPLRAPISLKEVKKISYVEALNEILNTKQDNTISIKDIAKLKEDN